jgi:hypothetical protein
MNYSSCPEPESNQRHEDFQSSALPTELSGLMTYSVKLEGEGFEPSKALPTDLQSAPFGRSGIPPNI